MASSTAVPDATVKGPGELGAFHRHDLSIDPSTIICLLCIRRGRFVDAETHRGASYSCVVPEIDAPVQAGARVTTKRVSAGSVAAPA